MARDEKLELLRQIPLFARFGRREIQRIGMLADEVDLPEGRVLMREGEPGEELFVLVRGAAEVQRGDRSVTIHRAGEFFGEIALLDGGPRTATVVLTEDSRLLVIGRRDFHSMMDEFPEVRLQLLEALAHRVRAAEPDSPH